MSGLIFKRTSAALALLAILLIHPAVALAQSQAFSPEMLAAVSRGYEELRRQNPDLEEKSAQQVAEELQAIASERRKLAAAAESVSARSAQGSVAATARCAAGYVLEGRHNATDRNVTILSAAPRDCDAGGCRAYEATAVSERTEPFDLDVSVVCSK